MANLGAFYGRHGRQGDAITLLERALRISPGNLEARINLGSAFARSGRFPEAAAEFMAGHGVDVAAIGAGFVELYEDVAKLTGIRLLQEGVNLFDQGWHRGFLVHALVGERTELGA